MTTRTLLLVVLLLTGCWPDTIPADKVLEGPGRRLCVTDCGALVGNVPETCDEVQAIENRLLDAYSPAFDRKAMCSSLYYATIYIRNDSFDDGSYKSFKIETGQLVQGFYEHDEKSIGLADEPLATSSLVHEFGHYMDYNVGDMTFTCAVNGCPNEHYRWKEKGICDALTAYDPSYVLPKYCR